MNALQRFEYQGRSVRIVTGEDGEPRWVAKDVCEALGYSVESGAGKIISHVPAQWRGGYLIPAPSGTQEMACLTEEGLYFFLNRSDKPAALPFQMWLAGEVIPAIRRTGGYVLNEVREQIQREGDPLATDTVAISKDTYIELLETKIKHLERDPYSPVLAGLDTRIGVRRPKPHRRFTPNERELIMGMHRAGLGYAEIAKTLQSNRSTIRVFVRRNLAVQAQKVGEEV